MEIFFICLVALGASLLTLFSGFGLGTILMPAMAIFFSLETAIALTAVVHFANNLFKLVLLGKSARWDVVWKFGAPGFVAAFAGAKILFFLENAPPLLTYSVGGRDFEITFVKMTVAGLIIFFLALEMSPAFSKLSFPLKFLPAGGAVSGFLGGLSGHQGALRAAFLVRCNLSKESFIATGVVIACLVDTSRIFVYAGHLSSGFGDNQLLLVCATLSAFLGVFAGTRLLKKITMAAVQRIVSVMLAVIAVLLAAGLI